MVQFSSNLKFNILMLQAHFESRFSNPGLVGGSCEGLFGNSKSGSKEMGPFSKLS